MKKINDQITKSYLNIGTYLKRLRNEEKGSFGIKEVAGTVAVIVIIGLAVTIVQGNLDVWIDEIWDRFTELIDGIVS